MKSSIKDLFSNFGLLLILMMVSVSGRSQEVSGGQYTMNIVSATAGTNYIDIALTISVANPSDGMRFGGFSTTINFNTAIINSGIISATYQGGRSSQLSGFGNNSINVATPGSLRLAISSQVATNAVNMTQGTVYQLGTWRISNTANWSLGNAGLWLQPTLTSGKTNSSVLGFAINQTSGGGFVYSTTTPVSPPGLILSHSSATSPYYLSVGHLCASSASQTASSAVTCFGGNNGSSTITLSPTPTVAAITYTVAGGASQSATLVNGAFTVTGLSGGTHSIIISNSGCSTVTATDVSVDGLSQLANSTTVAACDTYTWSVNGQAYTQSGTYTGTSTNVNGCTVAETLELTINSSTSESESITACYDYTWTEGTEATYTESGTYTSTSTNAAGCTHTKTLVLTISAPVTIADLPVATAICTSVGSVATITAVITSYITPTYQWQLSTDNGSSFSTITDTATYTGITTSALTITRTSLLPAAGTQYQLLVSGGCDGPVTSSVTTLTISAVGSVGAITPATSAVCTGINSTTLTMGAGSTGTIQWQSSTTAEAGSWLNFGGALGGSPSNPSLSTVASNLTATTYYRVLRTNGACIRVTGTPIVINVSGPPPTAGAISPANATVCVPLASSTTVFNADGSPITITSPLTNSTTLVLDGNTPFTTIVWQKSNASGATAVWSTVSNTTLSPTPAATAAFISGAGTTELTVGNLAATTWYRVEVSNGACKAYTNEVKITVTPSAKAGTISSFASVCTGSNITFTLVGSVGTSVQWQSSFGPGTTALPANWADIAGANGNSYTTPNLTAASNKSYRAIVTSGDCTRATTATKTIVVNPQSVAGIVTGGGAVCSDETASGTLKVSGNIGTIQWEYSTTGDATSYINAPKSGSTALDPPFGTSSLSSTAATYIITNIAGEQLFFRAKITSGACTSVYTNVVRYYTVSSAVAGTVTVANTTICSASGTSLTMTGSVGAIQWHRATVLNGVIGTFAPISAATAPTLSTGNLTATTAFKAIVSIGGSCATAATTPVIVTVNPVSKGGTVTPVVAGLVVCSGVPKVLKVATFVGNYNWQSTTAGTPTDSDWSDISDTQNALNYTAVITQATWFRVKAISGVCAVAYSNAVQLTISATAVAGEVTSDAAQVCTGTSATVTLTGNEGTIVWQKATVTNGVVGVFASITGATSQTVATGNLTATTAYRARVTNGTCISDSNQVIITVTPVSKAGVVALVTTIPAQVATVCNGTSVQLKAAVSIGTVVWESSTDGTFFTPIAGVTTPLLYTTGLLTQTTWFRITATSGACNPNSSLPFKITVTPAATAGSISVASATICSATATTLSSDSTGFDGAIVLFQKSVNSTAATPTWTNVTGTTTTAGTGITTLSTGSLTASTAFRRIAYYGTSLACAAVSNIVIVTVEPKPLAKPVTASEPAATATVAICTTVPNTLTVGPASIGNIQWQYSSVSTTSGWANIPGATGPSYLITNPMTGLNGAAKANYYRAVFTTTALCTPLAPVVSAAVTVWYKDCVIAKIDTEEPTSIKAPFEVKVYPNPYTETFNLSLSTASDAKVGIVVYDMTGRLIEQREVNANDVSALQVGDRYPSGVYNIVVTQGEEVKTLRVIKR